jgi:glutamyl-tRNA reductase
MRWLASFGFAHADELRNATDSLRDESRGPVELLPVSTCQRHELFCFSSDRIQQPTESAWLGEQSDAALRLFQLAAGLLSDIPGEQSVSRQLHAGLRSARRMNLCGKSMASLVNQALSAGHAIRERARESAPILELADLVRDLVLREINGNRGAVRPRILLLGAGELATSLHRALASAGFSEFLWATREPSRRRQAMKSLDEARQCLECDVVIAAISEAPGLIESGRMAPHAISIDLSVPAAITEAQWPLRRIVQDADERLAPQREALRRAGHRLPALADAALAQIVSPDVTVASRSIAAFRGHVVEQELRRIESILSALPEAQAQTLRRSIIHTAARCVHPLHETVNQLGRQGRADEAMTMIDHLLGSRVGWSGCEADEQSRSEGRVPFTEESQRA